MDDPISVSHALGPSSRISVPKNGQVRLDQQHQTVPQHGLRCPSSLNIFVHILLCVWGGGWLVCVGGDCRPASTSSSFQIRCLVFSQCTAASICKQDECTAASTCKQDECTAASTCKQDECTAASTCKQDECTAVFKFQNCSIAIHILHNIYIK